MLRYSCLISVFFALGFQINAQSIDTVFISAAIKKLSNAKTYTLEIARLMPAENFQFKPSADQMTFAQQLLHLSANLGWLSSSYLRDEKNPVRQSDMKLQDKDSIITLINRTYDYATNAIQRFSAEQLKDSVTFFAGPMTKLQIINLLNDHQSHHRGQLIVYLRMNGIKPPPYVGW